MPYRTRPLLACLTVFLALAVLALRGQAPVVLAGSPAQQSGKTPAAAPDGRTLAAITDAVTADVESLRGWTFKRPVPREVVGVVEVRRYLEQQLAVALPPARRSLVEAFLKTAGLIPADCDPVATFVKLMDQQVAGYYDPAAGKLFLVNRPDAMPDAMRRAVLAHELTHALDDQQVGLASLTDPRTPRTEDATVVGMSLTEGSAMSLMLHYMARQMAAGKVNPGEMASYLAGEMERAKALEQAPPYFNAQFGSYIIGAAFLARGDLQAVLRLPDDRSIGENLRIAWAAPPRSSEQVLHPEKYWDDARRDEPVAIDDRAVEDWLREAGRQVVYRDTLGELLTALFTVPRATPQDAARLLSSSAWTNPGAAGWGGDRFYVLATGSSEAQAAQGLKDLKGVWVTAWDSGKDREEFLAALAQGNPPPRYAAAPAGDRVAIVFIGFDASERDRLMRRLEKSPLPMTKAGRPWGN